MGIDPATKKYVPFDITDKKFATNYMNLVLRPIEKAGVDFWWLDWCCEGSRAQAPGLSADTWINAAYAKQHEKMGSRWPAFSRIGSSFQNGKAGRDNNGLGAFAEHRYSLHFTGDTCSTWPLMAFQAVALVARPELVVRSGTSSATRASSSRRIWMAGGISRFASRATA